MKIIEPSERCETTGLISRPKLMGELTKADNQRRYREMTGEEVYASVLTLLNNMPEEGGGWDETE